MKKQKNLKNKNERWCVFFSFIYSFFITFLVSTHFFFPSLFFFFPSFCAFFIMKPEEIISCGTAEESTNLLLEALNTMKNDDISSGFLSWKNVATFAIQAKACPEFQIAGVKLASRIVSIPSHEIVTLLPSLLSEVNSVLDVGMKTTLSDENGILGLRFVSSCSCFLKNGMDTSISICGGSSQITFNTTIKLLGDVVSSASKLVKWFCSNYVVCFINSFLSITLCC